MSCFIKPMHTARMAGFQSPHLQFCTVLQVFSSIASFRWIEDCYSESGILFSCAAGSGVSVYDDDNPSMYKRPGSRSKVSQSATPNVNNLISMFFKPAVTVFVALIGLSSLHIVSAFAANPHCPQGKVHYCCMKQALLIRGIVAQLLSRWRSH